MNQLGEKKHSLTNGTFSEAILSTGAGGKLMLEAIVPKLAFSEEFSFRVCGEETKLGTCYNMAKYAFTHTRWAFFCFFTDHIGVL